jgi:hypothetical protein
MATMSSMKTKVILGEGRISISIFGTRNHKLRADVKQAPLVGGPDSSLGCLGIIRFSVTLGTDKWWKLPPDMRTLIRSKARRYLEVLDEELTKSEAPTF